MIARAHDNADDEIEACDYCGLPLPRVLGWRWPWRKATDTTSRDHDSSRENTPRFCCSGCRFAADVAVEQQGEVRCSRWLVRLLASSFLTINVTMITMVLWSLDVYGVPESLHESTAILLAEVLRWASWLLSLPVLWMLGGPLYQEAKSQLQQGRLATDALLLAGVVAALGYSGLSLWQGMGAVYSEIACVVLCLVTLGRWLESLGKIRATAAIDSLAALLPATVRRLHSRDRGSSLGELNAGCYETVPLDEVRPGDRLWIQAGERIPVDALLIAGSAAIDEQLVNGESQPLMRVPGMTVPGGALSLDGSLVLECVAVSQQSSLHRIIQAVRAAQLEAGCYQQLVDRIAAVFTPAVMLIALGTLLWQAAHDSWSTGALAALSVMLIACPCALGIATPLALWTSMGRASQAQVLFRNGRALEQLANSSVLVFDKTGTLTTGTLSLESIECEPGFSPTRALVIANKLAEHSQHPISRAITHALQAQRPLESSTDFHLLDIQTLPGQGLAGVLLDETDSRVSVLLGNASMMDEWQMIWPQESRQHDGLASREGAVAYLAIAGTVCSCLTFDESIRREVPALLAALHQQGWQTELLSGDQVVRVEHFASPLGMRAFGGMLPADKTERLRQHQASGHQVVMVGDGINDAPALAAADVGIALGCGADISRQSADVCLLANDLSRIPWTVELARFTMRVVRQNLVWAFGYNISGIALAVAGKLNPIWAAFFMVAGSLVVIGNSMRLAAVALPQELAGSAENEEPVQKLLTQQVPMVELLQ